eukprot:CAMPEP_0206472898 /NCGR_PEP_ID=MMETSP0324_2-20121206/32512_1 /ASSEMBLY_ACC=CAM_ASM_000836 /TAXON_ID=2866 /ORGANISM="Crypthecodinium cohnii, Strain Seligo" /LENGTH=385 /DNA_ID=CAMNT_0053947661 /DNA_START=389 /DNA_END=1546 /DNA_ORIENTATION=+
MATNEVIDGSFAQFELVPFMGRPRWGAAAASVGGHLFVFGGYDGHLVERSAEVYVAAKGQWMPLPSLETARAQGAAVASSGKAATIYISGGLDGRHEFSSVLAFQVSTGTFSDLPPMQSRRIDHNAVLLQNCLYVIGGAEGGQSLDTVERLNLDTLPANPPPSAGSKSSPSPMVGTSSRPTSSATMGASSRPNSSAAASSAGGEAFASVPSSAAAAAQPVNSRGGADSGVVEGWEELPPMLQARRGACAVVARGMIWVLGGHNGCSALNSVEVFNPQTKAWEERTPMLEARFAASATCMGDYLYVFGGHDGTKMLSSSERFSLQPPPSSGAQQSQATPTWVPLTALPEARMFCCGALLDNPAKDPLAVVPPTESEATEAMPASPS